MTRAVPTGLGSLLTTKPGTHVPGYVLTSLRDSEQFEVTRTRDLCPALCTDVAARLATSHRLRVAHDFEFHRVIGLIGGDDHVVAVENFAVEDLQRQRIL